MSAVLDEAPASAPAPELAGRHSPMRAFKNGLAAVVMWLAFLVALVPLVWILGTVIRKGANLLGSSRWWQNSQRGITSREIGGGAYHAIVGTLEQALICAVIAVPLAVFTAIYLVEYGRGPLARVVSFMVDILTGIPSIVAALFVYAIWVNLLGLDRVGFAVSLALVLLMIPVVTRSTEEMLKLVPNELREASYALGVPKYRTILRIVLPTAFSGIITGILLGLARVMGETAPLLILGPYSKSININPFSGFQAALPTMINEDRGQVLPEALNRVWSAALTLILLILLLNVAGRLVARFSKVTN
jgi:phosphate transport system permease protein